MTIQNLIDKYGLQYWLNEFGWQGGTVHQVKTEMLSRLNANGMIEDRETGEIHGLAIQEPFTEILRPVNA